MFHVEISAGFHRARVFNLERGDLVAKVVEPWLDGKRIEMGDREWDPRDSHLKILEGPRMETTDLSFGQGWSNAERASENVTHKILQAAPPRRMPDAFVVESAMPEALTAEVVSAHGGRPVEWAQARTKLDGRDPEVAAVILVLRKDEE
jgi:hypothetical protein